MIPLRYWLPHHCRSFPLCYKTPILNINECHLDVTLLFMFSVPVGCCLQHSFSTQQMTFNQYIPNYVDSLFPKNLNSLFLLANKSTAQILALTKCPAFSSEPAHPSSITLNDAKIQSLGLAPYFAKPCGLLVWKYSECISHGSRTLSQMQALWAWGLVWLHRLHAHPQFHHLLFKCSDSTGLLSDILETALFFFLYSHSSAAPHSLSSPLGLPTSALLHIGLENYLL